MNIKRYVKKTILRLKLPLLCLFTVFILNNSFGLYLYGTNDALIRPIINVFFLGLAFFLIGIEDMSAGLQNAAGQRMRSLVSALTRNRCIGLLVGKFVTVIIQSSSATIVFLISFVKAGIMGFQQTLGVILGADIGTTITIWIVAYAYVFKLTDLAVPIFIIGFVISQIYRHNNYVKNIGRILAGFGVLFYGLNIMSTAMDPIKNQAVFNSLVIHLENPFFGILTGTLFTALINSSSASISLVAVMAGKGLIPLEAGIPLILGANIGTCITAVYASQGGNRDTKRVMLAHILFKIFGVLLFVGWIPYFAGLVRTAVSALGMGISSQVPVAHTTFNVAMALIFLPFVNRIESVKFTHKFNFAELIYRILPRKAVKFELITWHLNHNLITTPELAIEQARKKLSDIALLLEKMLRAIIIPFVSDEKFIRQEYLPPEEIELFVDLIPKRDTECPEWSLMEGIDHRENAIDESEEELKGFLREILQTDLTPGQVKEIKGMFDVAGGLEKLADIIHRNLLPLLDKKRQLNYDFSIEGKEELLVYHHKICKQIRRLAAVYAELDPRRAREVWKKRTKYSTLSQELQNLHLDRYVSRRRESEATDEVHQELLNIMKDINLHTGEIALVILDTWKEEGSSE